MKTGNMLLFDWTNFWQNLLLFIGNVDNADPFHEMGPCTLQMSDVLLNAAGMSIG